MTVSVSNRTIVRTILWVASAILVYKFIDRVTHPLTLIFVSFFLALALNPVVSWMGHKLRLKSRVRATAAAYLTVILVLIGFFLLVIPPLVQQTRDFIEEVPTIVSDFQRQDTGLSRAVERYNLNERLSNAARDFASEYSNFGSTLLDTGKRIIGAVVSIVAVLVLTFMMLVEGPRWLALIGGLMPAEKRAHRQKLAYKMYRAVSGFVNGQVALAVLAGTFALIALMIASSVMDVTINAVALAGIIAVFALIPLFGNLISYSIVAIVCLLNSVSFGLVMLIYFIVYQQIENMTIQPYIQSKLTKLTPLVVFVAALLGIGFGGLLGAIVAIPTAGAIKILLEDQFERRGLRTAPTESK